MSNEQKTTQEESCTPCGDMPFAAMMEKMMGQQGQGCGCTAPGVMTMCGGRAQDKEETVTETPQKA